MKGKEGKILGEETEVTKNRTEQSDERSKNKVENVADGRIKRMNNVGMKTKTKKRENKDERSKTQMDRQGK